MTKKKTDAVEVVFSFDTTGSMYPCLTQLREDLKSTVKQLFKDIPNIRIGIMAHGDDANRSELYDIKVLDLTDDQSQVVNFVNKVPASYGGGPHANYERVLNEARTISWTAGKSKVLVVIGDEVPHGPNFKANNGKSYNWRNDLDLLLEAGVNVHGVHCLPGIRPASKSFYEEIANKTGGFYLTLDQFDSITDLVMAICYKEKGAEHVEAYEKEVVKHGRMNRGMSQAFNALLGRKSNGRFSGVNMKAVDPSRFQVLKVKKDVPISDFVKKNGLTFKTGRGFYEFTKSVKIQAYKEVVLMDKTTGDMYSGDRAREIAGIPIGYDATVSPGKGNLANYTCFIQSTSNNRKLLGGTKFLYEVED